MATAGHGPAETGKAGRGRAINRIRSADGNAPGGSTSVMVGPRLFRSRWSALLWAGGILWTAYDVAAAMPEHEAAANGADNAVVANASDGGLVDATGVAVDARDLAVLANIGAAN